MKKRDYQLSFPSEGETVWRARVRGDSTEIRVNAQTWFRARDQAMTLLGVVSDSVEVFIAGEWR